MNLTDLVTPEQLKERMSRRTNPGVLAIEVERQFSRIMPFEAYFLELYKDEKLATQMLVLLSMVDWCIQDSTGGKKQ